MGTTLQNLPMELILPVVLLFLVFLLKLLIDQHAELPNIMYAFLELPLDILYLGLSFTLAYTILADIEHFATGVFVFIVYLIIFILLICTKKRAIKNFDKDKKRNSAIFGVINFSISIPALYFSIDLIMGGVII